MSEVQRRRLSDGRQMQRQALQHWLSSCYPQSCTWNYGDELISRSPWPHGAHNLIEETEWKQVTSAPHWNCMYREVNNVRWEPSRRETRMHRSEGLREEATLEPSLEEWDLTNIGRKGELIRNFPSWVSKKKKKKSVLKCLFLMGLGPNVIW